MKHYISEERAIYEDYYHGLFSKRLAEWAISMMETSDEATGDVRPLKAPSVDKVEALLKEHDADVPKEYLYTAWYLYAMAMADYPKTLSTDAQRVSYVEETLCDVDGTPENVLDCFVAKMCNAGVPIYWEQFI